MSRAVLVESENDTSLYEDLKLERQRLVQEVNFRTQLNQLMSEILNQSGDESMYQTMLEKAVSLIPGAQAGSMVIKVNHGYQFVAAVGFDLKVLSSILFNVGDFSEIKDWTQPVLNDYLDNTWEDIEHHKKEVFLKSGPTADIKVSLSIPVLYDGEIVVIFSLDSFESKDAFDDAAIRKAQLFATQIEVLWQRYILEKSLKDSEYRFKQLFLEADRRSKELQLLDELQQAIFNKLELSDSFDTVTKSIADIFDFAQVTISVIRGTELQRVSFYQNSNDVCPIPESLPLDDALVKDVLEIRKMKLILSDDMSGKSVRVTDRQSTVLVLPFCEDKLVRGVLFVESDTLVIRRYRE
jgi:GAF domain-containing protein